ncbi:MAG: ArsR/SmtB family transcription factor [Bacillota bacterium]
MSLAEAVRFLAALGQETRFKILKLLTLGPLCVCEIEEALQMSEPAVSQHLRILRNAGLIEQTREGQWVFCSLNWDRLEKGMAEVQNLLSGPIDQVDELRDLAIEARRAMARSKARRCK